MSVRPAAEVPIPGTDDVLTSGDAGGKVIRGSAWRVGANAAGIALGFATATLLLRHLGVDESGRYVTVLSLVAIAVYVADLGLNVAGSRELTLRKDEDQRTLIANLLGQRLLIMPLAVLLLVGFAAAVGYPARMVTGTALAGAGVLIVALANVLLLPRTVELRNAGIALIDFTKQAVGLVGVAILVALGASLTPFFAVQLLVGVAAFVMVAAVAGRRAFVLPRFDRAEQRSLLRTALPLAGALALGQVYFRFVIVLMSLISNPTQTAYFGGSLRAMETVVVMPILVASVALPLLAAAARDDMARLRFAVEGLSKGALIAGMLVIVVAIRGAEPVMAVIGGQAFRPAGAVLRIQVGALLFIALYQIWMAALLALGRQHELIFTNAIALLGLALFAVVLVPPFGAIGGAAATVAGDALLAALIYWRLSRAAGGVMVGAPFLLKVALAAALASCVLLIPGLPDIVAAVLAGATFLGVGQLIGMIPRDIREALTPRRLLSWRSTP